MFNVACNKESMSGIQIGYNKESHMSYYSLTIEGFIHMRDIVFFSPWKTDAQIMCIDHKVSADT